MGTALVTGGSVGIGRAFAERLARDGYDLVLVARDKDRLEEVASELRSRYAVDVEVLAADLSERPDMQRVADRLADAQRPVELLVNNAGFGLRKSFLGSDVEDQEQMLDVLCRAVLVLSHAAARAMADRGDGAIINVSSVAGFAAMGTYSAAKAWVTTFSEVLAGELRGKGVRVMALCPGFVRTEFHQRASINMSALPNALWLDADTLVDDAMADLARGRVISVPSLPYKVASLAARYSPRPLVRAVSGDLRNRRGR
ncbi:MAG TPA: SDR family oxidoreductase [Actinomycetales bacterium]|nr:SDR family oxidoreductase [Actinomycetales bacterium]